MFQSAKWPLRYLLLIPSFYGAMTWGGWLVLYQLKLISWNETADRALTWFWLVEAAFVAATVFSYSPYRSLWHSSRSTTIIHKNGVLALLHFLGFVGIGLQIRDVAATFGGLEAYAAILQTESHRIRWANIETASLGTQLSYFGWIAISLTVWNWCRGSASVVWIPIAFLQLVGNLVFIDRTRPTWIIFTAVLTVHGDMRHYSVFKRIGVVLPVVLIAIFISIAQWTGKIVYGDYGDTPLGKSEQSIYYYGTCGFAYFNHLLSENIAPNYWPARILRPLFMFLSKTRLAQEPPAEILDPYAVPFATNVGTFLEPFYRDGGDLYCILGIGLYTFGLNALGLWLLRRPSGLSVFLWANLCFAAFIAFFVPKMSTFPVWLFCGCALVPFLVSPLGSDHHENASSLQIRRNGGE